MHTALPSCTMYTRSRTTISPHFPSPYHVQRTPSPITLLMPPSPISLRGAPSPRHPPLLTSPSRVTSPYPRHTPSSCTRSHAHPLSFKPTSRVYARLERRWRVRVEDGLVSYSNHGTAYKIRTRYCSGIGARRAYRDHSHIT